MARVIGIGLQDFASLQQENLFYVDKTDFLSAWWQSKDRVTVITRPHRFGKTLLLKTVEHFFSCGKSDQAALFEELKVWHDDAMRPLAGTKPVIFLSFGDLKPVNATEA